MKPLRECAARLTHPKTPAWQRCASNVVPAWTYKRGLAASRPHLIDYNPARHSETINYVREMERLNNWVPTAYSCEPVELAEAA